MPKNRVFFYFYFLFLIVQIKQVMLRVQIFEKTGSSSKSKRCRSRDWKVAVSSPDRKGGIVFFSRVNFLCWLLFRFHPRVTAVARKRFRSFCQKCKWQVTAKHACTLRMWLCIKWRDTVHSVHRTRRPRWQQFHVARRHQPCQLCNTSVDIQNRTIKSWSFI